MGNIDSSVFYEKTVDDNLRAFEVFNPAFEPQKVYGELFDTQVLMPATVQWSTDDPLITPELADYAKARNTKGTVFPAHQKTHTESFPTGYWYDCSKQVVLPAFFGNPNPVDLSLPPKVFDGVVNNVSVAMDLITSVAPITYAPTDFWMSQTGLSQNEGDQSDMIQIYPETKLLWLQTCVKTEHLTSLLKQRHYSEDTKYFMGLARPTYPSTTSRRFYYYMDEGFLNKLRIYLQTMRSTIKISLKPRANIIAYNPTGTGTFTLNAVALMIQTKMLTPYDRIIIEEDSKKTKKAHYYLNARPIPLTTALSITSTNNVVNAFNIAVANDGGRVVGYQVTYRLAGSNNTNNGYMSGCVHPGDAATLDLKLGTASIVNKGVPLTIEYYENQILNNCGQSFSDLRNRFPYSVILPLTSSISAAFNGCPRGFRWTIREEDLSLITNPVTLVPEVQTITKQNGGYPYTAGSWQYEDPVTKELSSEVFFGSSLALHAAAIGSWKRSQAYGWDQPGRIVFSDTFNDGNPTVTITIISYLTNGVGGTIRIVPKSIISNAVPEAPTVAITIEGQRGFTPNIALDTTVHALYLMKARCNDGILFYKTVGHPRYKDGQSSAAHVNQAISIY